MRQADDASCGFDAGDSDPLDQPWYGVPWPPYLPTPEGQLLELTSEGAKLCVGPGWFSLVDRAFAQLKRFSAYSIRITGVMHIRGALVLNAVARERTADDTPFPVACALEEMAFELDQISYESATTCEVCGDAVGFGGAGGLVERTMCIDHSLAYATGVNEQCMWEEYGWTAPVRVEAPLHSPPSDEVPSESPGWFDTDCSDDGGVDDAK
jgi:hypothetical protein